jgi:hypothetical protein
VEAEDEIDALEQLGPRVGFEVLVGCVGRPAHRHRTLPILLLLLLSFIIFRLLLIINYYFSFIFYWSLMIGVGGG